MKLLTLNLKAVGPFSNVVLDLSPGDHGLHLIYGPNEAGKTSTLRSLSYLLFGFPHLSADNFVHANDQLRVGARLRRSDGEELEIIRRRGKLNNLRGSDDAEIVSDERLARFLGGIDKDTFESLFGIDHARLTRAGDEIRTGQGRLGELLFAAGAGLAGLGQAQRTLQQGLDEIFRPKAQNPRINKLVAEFRSAHNELRSLQLPIETWQTHDRALNESIATAERIRDQIRAARTEQARLKRLRSAIPLVAKRSRLTEELRELGDAVRLRDDFGPEFRQWHDQLRIAELAITHAESALAESHARLTELNPPHELLEAARQIESLQERLGAVEKASADRVKIESWLHDCDHEARRILRELDRPLDLDQAEALRLRVDEPPLVRNLAQRFAQLRVRSDDARRTVARQDDQIKRHSAERAGLPEPREIAPLRRAVSEGRKVGDIDRSLVDARIALVEAEKKMATALARLSGWSGSARDLERLPIPLDETIDRFESQFQDLARGRQSLAERLAAERDAIRELESRLQVFELNHDVPTEETLRAARDRRDRGWRLIKSSWLDNTPSAEAIALFLAEFRDQTTLATAYEQSADTADHLADRLRREADRVAQRAESIAQLNRCRSTLLALEEEARRSDARQAEVDREWHERIAHLGIDHHARTPTELRGWLREREQVTRLMEKVEEARALLDPIEHTLADRRAGLILALKAAGESLADEAAGLAPLLDQADMIIARQVEVREQRATLETQIATAQAERAAAQLTLHEAEAELEAWRTEWSALMKRIGLEPDALPDQAEIFLTKNQELAQRLADRRNHARRLEGMDRDADEFRRDVNHLVARLAPDWPHLPASEFDQARELARRLRAAQDDAQKCATLTQQIEREQANLREALTRRDRARVCLERLCQEAGCTQLDAVPEAERRSERRARLEADRAACAEQLLMAAAGTDLAAFTAQAEAADPDTLDDLVHQHETEIAAQEDELRRLDQTIGALRGELARMDGSDRAAESAEQIQTLLARIQADVARFATLKLAAIVMQRGIERYRDKNQGPILARAGALFAEMTGQSFTRLQIDDDGEGRSVLKGVRPDGRLVQVEQMSDGSHDQLYLALRLASLESWLSSHEPIPFVVDDILLNFDDLRASAALRALADLSKRTQVLFFTHHRHIIDLAHTHLPTASVFVHELPGPARRGTATTSNLPLGEGAAK